MVDLRETLASAGVEHGYSAFYAYLVVLFTMPDGRYILHRVVRIRKGRMLTCGDGNITADGWNPMKNVLCAATRFERNGRIHRLESFPWRMLGLVWMGLFPVRPVLFKAMRRIVKGYRRLSRRDMAPDESVETEHKLDAFYTSPRQSF